jgi:hypothetical protein
MLVYFAHSSVNDVILGKRPYITWVKQEMTRLKEHMKILIKYLIYIVILAFLGLVAYAYVGPMFGSDFDAPKGEIRIPVVLDAN